MEEKRGEKKICLHCGRKHITPSTPEDEYRQMDICRNQEWKVRTGCVHPEITAFYRCEALIPRKYEIYRFTKCRKYEEGR